MYIYICYLKLKKSFIDYRITVNNRYNKNVKFGSKIFL